MSIMLGNLSVQQLETRTGVTFSDELKTLLKETHELSANNIPKGKWHCFDLPFHMVCGDMDIAQKIYDHLKPFASDFKEQLQISISN